MRLASWRWGNRSTGSSLRSVRLDGFLPYALKSGDVAGAVVVVVNDREVLIQQGYGYADVAKRTRGDPERTLFRIGSVAKRHRKFR